MTEKSKRPRESGLDPYRLARRFAKKLLVATGATSSGCGNRPSTATVGSRSRT
jgi:hypothetical protein